MKIHRKIERTLELTADEIYKALAEKYDLDPKTNSTHMFLDSESTIFHHVNLVAIFTIEENIAPEKNRDRGHP